MSLSRTRANLAFLQPDGMAAKQTAAKKSEVAPLRLFFQKMRPPQKSRMLTGETASAQPLQRHIDHQVFLPNLEISLHAPKGIARGHPEILFQPLNR